MPLQTSFFHPSHIDQLLGLMDAFAPTAVSLALSLKIENVGTKQAAYSATDMCKEKSTVIKESAKTQEKCFIGNSRLSRLTSKAKLLLSMNDAFNWYRFKFLFLQQFVTLMSVLWFHEAAIR